MPESEAERVVKKGPKFAGVPIIAAVGIPALGYIGWRWIKSKRTQNTSSPANTGSGGLLSGYTPNLSDPQGLMTVGAGGIGGGTGSVYTVPGTTPLPGSGVTLDAWGQMAENWLMSQGMTPLDAVSAVNAYESGQALSPSSESLINKALNAIGAPPNAPTALAMATAQPVSTIVPQSTSAGETASPSIPTEPAPTPLATIPALSPQPQLTNDLQPDMSYAPGFPVTINPAAPIQTQTQQTIAANAAHGEYLSTYGSGLTGQQIVEAIHQGNPGAWTPTFA